MDLRELAFEAWRVADERAYVDPLARIGMGRSAPTVSEIRANPKLVRKLNPDAQGNRREKEGYIHRGGGRIYTGGRKRFGSN